MVDHIASLERALHWINCDNMNTKSVCTIDLFYFILINLGTRLSFSGAKFTLNLVPSFLYLVILVPKELYLITRFIKI